MKSRFTVGRRIGFGFAILIVLTLSAFVLTITTIDRSSRINETFTKVYTPSVTALKEFNILIINSKMLIGNWVNIDGYSDDKPKLKKLIKQDYPDLKVRIYKHAQYWTPDERDALQHIFNLTDNLFERHEEVMHALNTIDAYKEPMTIFTYKDMVFDETSGEIFKETRLVLNLLTKLTSQLQTNTSYKIAEMNNSFSYLHSIVLVLAIGLPILSILTAILTVLSIVKPVDELKKILQKMSLGILPQERIKEREDEIGEMSFALNELVSSMKLTTNFAKEVGSGNFDSYFKPLSQQDSLGLALIKMRENLRANERVLEQKVQERTLQVVNQKKEIETQKQKIEVLFTHVTDSIKYAKRIQEAILPPDEQLKKLLPESFVLYKPKDIVSGDFYWIEQKNDKVLFAVVDCTGHGVPGAFMSIVGYNQLQLVVNKNEDGQPASILNDLNKGIRESLHQGNNYEDSLAKDGMDISFCTYDPSLKQLQFAAAFNPLYLIRDNKLIEIKGDKFPVGIYLHKEAKLFTNHTIDILPNDTIYIFSDGYSDQFGGPSGKKFMSNRFKELLVDISKLPMSQQKNVLDRTIEIWKGAEDQVDDVVIMGVKFQ